MRQLTQGEVEILIPTEFLAEIDESTSKEVETISLDTD